MSLELLTKKQAAEILLISPVTLDRLRKSGSLNFRQIGAHVRFLPQDLEEFLDRSRSGQPGGNQ
jgi:excisionase family DNA binding protein